MNLNKLIDENNLIDVTRLLGHDTPVYPGDTPLCRDIVSDDGEHTLSSISMSCHAGTHMDAPFHFCRNGNTIDDIAVSRFFLPAILIDCRDMNLLHPHILTDFDWTDKAILIKTRNAETEDLQTGCFLTDLTAKFLVQEGISLVGIDRMSVDRPGESSVHRILLGADIPIVESLDLESVSAGNYFLFCFPIKIEGSDGAPVRAFLYDHNN